MANFAVPPVGLGRAVSLPVRGSNRSDCQVPAGNCRVKSPPAAAYTTYCLPGFSRTYTRSPDFTSSLRADIFQYSTALVVKKSTKCFTSSHSGWSCQLAEKYGLPSSYWFLSPAEP